MESEQAFLRVHTRLSGVLARLLTPKLRSGLEFVCLCNAVMLLGLLVVMHVNFVAQPGCAEHFSSKEMDGAQLVRIKITGSWNRITEEAFGRSIWKHDNTKQQHSGDGHSSGQHKLEERYEVPDMGGEGWNILAAKFWLNLLGTSARRNKFVKRADQQESVRQEPSAVDETGLESDLQARRQSSSGQEESFDREVASRPLSGPGRGPLGTALLHYSTRWSSYGTSWFKRVEQSIRSFWQVWRIAGWEPFTTTPKGDRRTLAWTKLDAGLVDKSESGGRMYDPTYLYSTEKGYLMMSESAKFRHSVKTINISISAQHSCFGNRWQQLLIDNFVGYDTILMNSLLSASGRGFLYNFQTKELYNLNYLQDFGDVALGIDDYIVFKSGVLITTLFVFFTTTMSVSFTLRETQARMLKFTVQLQHHARHRLPTFRLIFIHVVESLVFVPIMIGILFFLFEFFDDQLLAFMVLTLVWLCELFTMISVRTPMSMQFFPCFFFLYFMVFHIYFFSYTYGFSYLAFSATAAFMQHLVLYFWNRLEVPALQYFLHRRTILQQQGVHITSSTILTSTVQVNQANTVFQSMRGLAGLNHLRFGTLHNQVGMHPLPPSGTQGTTNSRPESSVENNNSNTPPNPTQPNNNPNAAGANQPGMGSWMNTPMHEIDSITWRRMELERLHRDRDREQGTGFGGDASSVQAQTAQTANSPFTTYRSVLPWILGDSSLFFPVFHDLGGTLNPQAQNSEESGDVDNTTTNLTTSAGSSASQSAVDSLRSRHVDNSVGEGTITQ